MMGAVLLIAAVGLVGAQGRFTNPVQPWDSPDGRVHLLRPAIAALTVDDRPLGALASPGWRLVWDGAKVTPGRVLIRLVLKVAPNAPEATAIEGLQIGVGRGPGAVRSCLTYGLKGGSAVRRPDRIINGRRFAVWTNGDAGMSQRVSATDLRTVVGGACYAVERFGYGGSASSGDPLATLPQAKGADLLDAGLASLEITPQPSSRTLTPPHVTLPKGAVAR